MSDADVCDAAEAEEALTHAAERAFVILLRKAQAQTSGIWHKKVVNKPTHSTTQSMLRGALSFDRENFF